ncbi:MAG: HD domain-containing protein [Anaerolineae bacterium]|nr:HD domain-containing protein [Anaerolineae bacterium]
MRAMSEGLARVERYVRETMDRMADVDLCIAHGYDHVDRVRRWALRIAAAEGYPDPDLVEAAALLHDIGLAHLEPGMPRREHGAVGAQVAGRFLAQEALFSGATGAIADAVRCHNALGGGGALGAIVRDADMLDALGAVGVARAFASRYMLPMYDSGCVLGETWNLTARDYDRRCAEGRGIGPHIVDQVNFQLSFYDNLTTDTARRLARPLVATMRAFLCQLACEVEGTVGLPDGPMPP